MAWRFINKIQFKYKDGYIRIVKNNHEKYIKNQTDKVCYAVLASTFKASGTYARIIFKGKILNGTFCTLKAFSLSKKHSYDITFNSESI